MRVTALGLDYRHHVHFEMIVPYVYPRNGKRRVSPAPGIQVGDDEYQFCKLLVNSGAYVIVWHCSPLNPQ